MSERPWFETSIPPDYVRRAERDRARIKAAEEKLREAEKTNDQMQIANDQLGGELDDLREKLRAVVELPGKWRGPGTSEGWRHEAVNSCADELDALLKKEGAL